MVNSFEDFADYIKKFNPKKYRIVCRFRDNAEFEQTEKILSFAYEAKNLTVAIDEVDMICSTTNMLPSLWNIINYGRNDSINLYTTARRAAAVSRTLTAEADEIHCFKVEEPNDLKYLSERGFIPEQLKLLEKFNYKTNI